MEMYRQGDLLFKKVSNIPNSVSLSKDNIILRGEATGHSHRLVNGLLFKQRQFGLSNVFREVFIKVGPNGKIIHEEHATLELPTGIFQVIRQVEYSPWGSLNVND